MTEDDLKEGGYEEAARLYQALAAQGSARALYNLGLMHELGNLGRRDETKATSFYERAASAGDADAQYYLGRLFERKGDFSSARKWLLEGAKQNHKPSLAMAGRMLVRGEGGEVEFRLGMSCSFVRQMADTRLHSGTSFECR